MMKVRNVEHIVTFTNDQLDDAVSHYLVLDDRHQGRCLAAYTTQTGNYRCRGARNQMSY